MRFRTMGVVGILSASMLLNTGAVSGAQTPDAGRL